MKRCIRPLIGKIPYDILKKYEEEITERVEDYGSISQWCGVLMGFIIGLVIGLLK